MTQLRRLIVGRPDKLRSTERFYGNFRDQSGYDCIVIFKPLLFRVGEGALQKRLQEKA